MARPVTLFTGQWADLSIDEMARKTKEFGYDGIELACWGDHFEVDKALADDNYCAKKRGLLEANNLECHAISAHLVGAASTSTVGGIPWPSRPSASTRKPLTSCRPPVAWHRP